MTSASGTAIRADGPATRPPAAAVSRGRRRISGPWWYLLPGSVMIGAWIYLPLLFTVVLSFMHWNLINSEHPLVGLDNYRRLFSQPEFPSAMVRTVLYIAGLLPFATVLPMGLAVLLWKHPGRAAMVYRTLLFVPVILAPVATAVSWRFILDPLQGVANRVLDLAGISGPNWLGSKSSAIWIVVVITGTKLLSLNILLYLAGLATIDRRHVDACRMDGATEWEVTRHILVPLLSHTTALVSFLCVVLAGQWAFVNVSVLTQGGPEGSTDNVFYQLYQYGFSFFDTGLAAAATVIIMAAFVVLTVLHRGISQRLVARER